MSQPTISVVIPVHKADPYLGRSLASIAAQTVAVSEVILVDNGTTPSLAEKLKQAASLNIRVITHQAPGASGARNAGIRACRGDWIAFLDADDAWRPGKLARQLEAAQRWPEAVMIATGIQRITAAGDRLSSRPRRRLRRDFCRPVFSDLLCRRVWFVTSTTMVRRQVLERLGAFDTDLQVAEDWDLFLRIAREHPIAYLAAPLVDYTVSPGSLMHRTDNARVERDWRKVIERHAPAAAPAALRGAWAVLEWYFGTTAHVARDYQTAVQRLWRAAQYQPTLWRVYPALVKGLARSILG